MMRRRTWLLAVAMAMVLAGCKSQTAAPADSAGTAAAASEPAADDSLQKVLGSGKLRAGAEGNWNPFVYNDVNDGGKLKGYDVEIVEEIARRLGVEVEWSIASKWDGVIAGLQADRYDVVFCGITKANLASGADLIGTIAYREDPIVRRIDCHVNSQIAFNTYRNEKKDAEVHVAATYVPEDPTDSEIYGMLASSKKTLQDKLDEILLEMLEDGYCKDFAVKYFGQEVADNIKLYDKYN